MTTSRLRLAGWFLARPRLYPEFARFIGDRIATPRSDRRREKDQATSWCESLATSTEELVAVFTGGGAAPPFSERFAAELASAKGLVEATGQGAPLAGNLELIHACCEHANARSAIETGVGAGWSSLSFLLSLRRREGSALVSTSMPFPGSTRAEERAIGAAVLPELRSLWTLIRRPDRAALPRALRRFRSLDVCHYDSDKSRGGRLWAYPRLWAAVRPGGVFISDDIDDNLAFREFCNAVGQIPLIARYPATVGFRYVGILRRPGAPTPTAVLPT